VLTQKQKASKQVTNQQKDKIMETPTKKDDNNNNEDNKTVEENEEDDEAAADPSGSASKRRFFPRGKRALLFGIYRDYIFSHNLYCTVHNFISFKI
jgi:hypothetical protein